MTREDVKKMFPDATDEQITAFLNKHNAEIAAEKVKTAKESKRADALQTEKDQREREGMGELEKLQSDFAAMQKSLEASQAENRKLKLTTDLAGKGVVGENATKLIESFIGGEFDVAAMAQIIEDAKTAAIAEHDRQSLKDTPDPTGKGKKGGDGDDVTPEDVAFASGITFGKSADSAKAAIDYYTK